MGYNLLINGYKWGYVYIYWGCNPFTHHLLISWDIQVYPYESMYGPKEGITSTFLF